jgi:autotransporter-associated beta strand protein
MKARTHSLAPFPDTNDVWCSWLLRGVFATFALTFVTLAHGQVFVSQGPGNSSGPTATVQSGDAPPSGTVSGAVQAVVADPTNANILYAGGVNGGVWKTTNGGVTWTPLTDNQASLSIATLALDPANSNTIYAGIGTTSNFVGQGGISNGLLKSTNGGTSWTALNTGLPGQSVSGITVQGNTILVSTYQPSYTQPDTTGGLFRSTNGGASFTKVVPGTGLGQSGLGNGPVTSLVSSGSTLYAAVTAASSASYQSTSVYRSTDGGATWAQIFNNGNSNGTITTTNQTTIRLAAGPNNTLAVGVVNINTNVLTGVFYTSNATVANPGWTTLTVPTVNNGNQGAINFAIAIDPNNANFVYVSGDRLASSPFTATVFRINVSSNTATSITDGGTSNGSTLHADTRNFAFDANGRLILTSDGGIYARSNPQSNTGAWTGLNGNLSVFQAFQVAYDANSKRLAVAAQDTGVALQSAPNSLSYNAIQGGDGAIARFNDRTLAGVNQSVLYNSNSSGGTSSDYSNLKRLVLDSNGNAVSPTPSAAGIPISFNVAVGNVTPFSPFTLNRVTPSRIALGGSDVYVTQDPLTNVTTTNSLTLNLTDVGTTTVGTTTGSLTAIAYGTLDNSNVLVAGSNTGLWISTTAAANSLSQLTNYAGNGFFSASGIVFDPRSQNRFFVADQTNLYSTTNATTVAANKVTFTNLTANLPAGMFAPTSVEFISTNGVNALLVGGINNYANAQSPIAVADSNGSGNLSGWRLFGRGLPNTFVYDMGYNPTVDVLAVSSFGRGAWVMYDVTSNFAQATVLQFGLANNDSHSDIALLTDGTQVGGGAFVRPLNKYGPGTLVIEGGDATYSGNTNIFGGTLQLGDGTNSGRLVNSPQIITSAGTHILLSPGLLGPDLIAGAISGPANLTQAGPGTSILTGANTYNGGTSITGGTLQLGDGTKTGSLTGDVSTGAGTFFAFNPGTGTPLTLNGVISGGGTVVENGPGKTTLTGNNSYQGGTNFNGGTLSVSSDNNLGAPGGILRFNGGILQITGTTFTTTGRPINWGVLGGGFDIAAATNIFPLSQSLTGPGGLAKLGAGTLLLSGANTYSGGTDITAGTLKGGAVNTVGTGRVFVEAAGTLDLGGFNQTIGSLTGSGIVRNTGVPLAILTTGTDNTNVLFSGQIQDDGPTGLTKTGTGTQILTGINPFTGPTLVNGGILEVDGSIGSNSTTAASGGTLRGTGTIGSSTASAAEIQSGGTLAPGSVLSATPSTLTFTGTLTFDAGSFFQTRVIPGGANDKVLANKATLNGGEVDVIVAGAGVFLPGTKYTILTAGGGVTGTFAALSFNTGSPFIVPNLGYDPTDAFLQIKSDFAKLAQTPNQKAVATGVDNAGNAGGYGPAGAAFLTALITNNTVATLPATLNSLSGEGISGQQQTALNAGNVFVTTVLGQGTFWADDRSNDIFGLKDGGYKDGPACSLKDGYDCAIVNRGRFWAAGFGEYATLTGEASTGSATLKSHNAGVATGVDYEVNRSLLLGIASGYSDSSFSVKDRATTGTVEGGYFGIYGVERLGSFYVAGTADYAHYNNTTDRFVTGLGPVEEERGRFSSEEWLARLETGNKYPVSGVNVTPFLGFQLAGLWNSAFSEHSTGLAGLHVNAQTIGSEIAFAGVQFDMKAVIGGGWVLTPFVRFSWEHEFDPSRSITASLVALPGSGFTVFGPSAAQDFVRLSSGFKLDVTADVALFASFNAEGSDRGNTYAGTGGVKIRW